jgi:hypothetical protein
LLGPLQILDVDLDPGEGVSGHEGDLQSGFSVGIPFVLSKSLRHECGVGDLPLGVAADPSGLEH